MEGCQLDKSALYSPSISMLVLQNIYKQIYSEIKNTHKSSVSPTSISMFLQRTRRQLHITLIDRAEDMFELHGIMICGHMCGTGRHYCHNSNGVQPMKRWLGRGSRFLWWFHSPPSSPFRQHSSCTISARFRSCEELWILHWQYQLRTRCPQQQHNTMTMAGNKSLVRERHNGVIVALWRNRGGSLWPPNPTSSVCECVCVWDAETSCVISKVEHDSSY